MKNTLKRALSFLIVGVMIFSLMPMTALAAVTYASLDYDWEIYPGEGITDHLYDGYYFDLNTGEIYSGYEQCYSAYLSGGSKYTLEIDDSCENAEYIERTIIILKYITGNLENDILVLENNYDNMDTLNTILEFTAPTTGYVYILSLAYALDENDDLITGDDFEQSIYLSCDGSYDYTDLDYSETVKLDTPSAGYIDESEPVLMDMFNYESGHKGYNIQLQGGKQYIFEAVVFNKNTENMENIYNYGMVALLNNNLTGDVEADCIAKAKNYENRNTPASVVMLANIEETGTYKILFNRISKAKYPYYGSENTVALLSVREAVVSDFDIYTKQDLIDFNIATVWEEADVYNVNFHADIDMTGEEWSPVCCYAANVSGNDHAIKGMCEPLFENVAYLEICDIDVEMNYNFNNIEEYCGYTAAIATYVYEKLYMSGCNVTGSININAGAAYDIGGLVADVCTTSMYVDDCTVDMNIQIITNSDGYVDYVGGAFAYIEAIDGYIGNVEYTGNILINADAGYYSYIGGFVGEVYVEESISFENCSAKGVIIAMALQNTTDNKGYNVGGFAGYLEDYASFTNCFAEVSVATNGATEVGGFAGYIDEANSFTNCYATGSVSGSQYIGGFVGESCCCGYNLFLNCYALGNVSGAYYVGGFIGYAYDGDTFINCYAAGNVITNAENYIGGFIGYGEGCNDLIFFDHCYAASAPAIGYCKVWDEELFENVEITDAVAEVNFKDADDVLNMEQELNAYVEYLTANEGVYGLLKWGGRNEKGGPNLIVPCEHVYPDKYNGYDENSHWYACTNPDCTNPDERYLENDHVPVWVTVKEAEIGEEGLKQLICEKCDYCLDEEVIPGISEEPSEEPSEEESSEPEESQPEDEEPEIMIGDVNGNGKIDMADYVLLKRAYFGTYKFTDNQNIAGDINKNGKIDMSDYVLLKRAYFGTYVIK